MLDIYDGVKNGGVVSARRFVDALRTRHDVTVVTTGPEEPGRVAVPGFYPPLLAGLMREMGFVFGVPRRGVLEEVFRACDVVHVQFPFWLGVRAAGIARRMGKPLVAGSHVQPENLLYNVGLRAPRLSAATYRLFVRTLYGRADAVVCPSALALEDLRRHGLTAPAEVISNGVGPQFRPGAMERFPRHEGKFLVLAVGRLAREKRLDVVIDGVRRSRHAARVQLVITGRGPREAHVRALAAGLPNPAEVGFVTDEDLQRLLHTADVLVHASEVELEGMAVLEALGCGLPALIADEPLSAARQFAVDPEFLFRAGDAADLAGRLDRLIEDPGRLAVARERCVARAGAYAFEESVRKLESVYRRVVSGARAVPAARSTARPAGR